MDLEIQTIKQCFFLFTKTLDIRKINIPAEEKIETMNINEIRANLDVIYMEYIVNSICSINDDGLVTRAYKHLDRLIKKYMKNVKNDKVKQLEEKLEVYQDSVFPNFVELNKNRLEQNVSNEDKEIKRQWGLF